MVLSIRCIIFGFTIHSSLPYCWEIPMWLQEIFPRIQVSIFSSKVPQSSLLSQFSEDQWSRITDYYHQEADRREKTQQVDMFEEEQSKEETSILHSDGMYTLENNINTTLTDFSSFPWQEFTGDMTLLEQEVGSQSHDAVF